MQRNVVIFIFGLYICTVYGQLPGIVDEIWPEVKPVGGTAYLNCTVVHKSAQTMVLWQKVQEVANSDIALSISEDETIVFNNNDQQGDMEDAQLPKYEIIRTVNGNRQRFTLVIRYLQEEDDGMYECVVRKMNDNDAENWPTKLGNLLVQTAPVISNMGASVYEVKAGGNLTLTCSAHGKPAPNITWIREDGGKLRNGRFVVRGADLFLNTITQRDRGNYICVADNSVRPPADFKVEVKVFYSPTCRPTQSSVGQAQNRRFNAKLECIVGGHPTPSMHWEKIVKGVPQQISDNDKYATEIMSPPGIGDINEKWYLLLVKNVQANDFGDFYCVATNAYGRNFTRIKLFETMECQGANCPSISTGGANALSACFLTFLSVCISVLILKLLKY